MSGLSHVSLISNLMQCSRKDGKPFCSLMLVSSGNKSSVLILLMQVVQQAAGAVDFAVQLQLLCALQPGRDHQDSALPFKQ